MGNKLEFHRGDVENDLGYEFRQNENFLMADDNYDSEKYSKLQNTQDLRNQDHLVVEDFAFDYSNRKAVSNFARFDIFQNTEEDTAKLEEDSFEVYLSENKK